MVVYVCVFVVFALNFLVMNESNPKPRSLEVRFLAEEEHVLC